MLYLLEVVNTHTNQITNLKLGYTKDLAKRLTTLECGTGESIKYNTLWTKKDVPIQFETYVHKRLTIYNDSMPKIGVNGRNYRKHKEAYIDHPDVRNLDVDSLYNQFCRSKKLEMAVKPRTPIF